MELIRDVDRWWPLLSEPSREWLAEDPDRPLPAEIVLELVRVRGYGPVSARWVESEPDGGDRFFLTDEERDWIRSSARRNI